MPLSLGEPALLPVLASSVSSEALVNSTCEPSAEIPTDSASATGLGSGVVRWEAETSTLLCPSLRR